MSSSPFCTMRGRSAQLAAFTHTDMLMASVGPMVSWLGTTMNVRRIGGELQRRPDPPGFQSGPQDVDGPPWLPMPELSHADVAPALVQLPVAHPPAGQFRRSRSGVDGGGRSRGTSGANSDVQLGRPVAAWHARAAAGASHATASRRAAGAALRFGAAGIGPG